MKHFHLVDLVESGDIDGVREAVTAAPELANADLTDEYIIHVATLIAGFPDHPVTFRPDGRAGYHRGKRR
jgi:hypothetical protein